MKPVRLIKTCLNKTYNKLHTDIKYLSDTFPIQISLKQDDALKPLFFNFSFEYAIK
jgi:hypothetical protein